MLVAPLAAAALVAVAPREPVVPVLARLVPAQRLREPALVVLALLPLGLVVQVAPAQLPLAVVVAVPVRLLSRPSF
jgi:hypothetical protein